MLVFASEIKAMLPILGRLKLSPQGMAQVFTFWAAVAPGPYLMAIEQLRPGQCMVFKEGSTEVISVLGCDLPGNWRT